MDITNGKLLELDEILHAVSMSNGGAKLKYAVNLNRTLMAPHVANLREVQSEPIDGATDWIAFKNSLILEDCKKDDAGEPILNGGNYTYADYPSFVAKLERLRWEKFSHLIEAETKANESFQELLKETVSISDFPFVIKWDFIQLDESGELRGITGPQQYVLMKSGFLPPEAPPWLSGDSDGTSDKPKPE